jgi:L-ascorbate metabolism protein UlaG (beta-lactamase superfamily)/pimeloyl-ACP methyl ester carboxylesterase
MKSGLPVSIGSAASIGALSLLPLLPIAAAAQTVIPASGGDITITPLMHASVQVEHRGVVIQVDPAMGDLTKARPADLVLVTHAHDDHLNPGRIARLRKPGAPVVVPSAVLTGAGRRIKPPIEVLANGEAKTVAGVLVEAVAMYNLQHEFAPGRPFHPKGEGNGYVVTIGGKRLYFAGDTECVPEVRALRNIDVAFVPMNLPFTMSPADAAECVKAFLSAVVYPYHYLGQDPGQNPGQSAIEFQTRVAGSGIDARLLDWYPPLPREDVIAVKRPGAMIDVGGRRLHVNCVGNGQPTVVLEAGEVAFALDWSLVQPEVSKTTRVCSYDRAGSGWSDPTDRPETAQGVIADLHAALRAAGERPPYVLVGHSLGGIYARAFEHGYPDEVAGLVLVDATHEDVLKVFVNGRFVPAWAATGDQLRASFPRDRPKDPPPLPPPSTDEPYDKLPADVLKTRVTFETRLFTSMFAMGPDQVAEAFATLRDTLLVLHDAAANGAHPLGSRPLIVLTAEYGPDPEFTGAEAKLTALSTNAVQRVVADSGHEIHLFDPPAVVRAIQDVVNAVRGGSLLRDR